jgi:hypothetical protein
MATLNPSNVVNGNTIQASDIEQLYNAFGTGSAGFTPISGVKLTGSLLGNASTATISTSASYALTSTSASYANNATSASYAVTASYAANSAVPVQIYGTSYSASVGTPNTLFSFLAGYGTTGAISSTSSITITQLTGKTLGTSAFVTATVSGSNGANTTIVVNSLAGNILTFQSSIPSTPFYYTVFYV